MLVFDRMGQVMTHLEEHVNYPATKDQIIKACNDMSDVPLDAKDWILRNLTDRRYQNSEEVKKILGFD